MPYLKFPQNLPMFRVRWGRREWVMEGGERHAGRETHKERRRKKRRRRKSGRVWRTSLLYPTGPGQRPLVGEVSRKRKR